MSDNRIHDRVGDLANVLLGVAQARDRGRIRRHPESPRYLLPRSNFRPTAIGVEDRGQPDNQKLLGPQHLPGLRVNFGGSVAGIAPSAISPASASIFGPLAAMILRYAVSGAGGHDGLSIRLT